MASMHEMERLAKEQAIRDMNRVKSNNPESVPMPPQQPVQAMYDEVTNALSELRESVAMLDERLGYVSRSKPECAEGGIGPNEPERSPMAHNLHCILCEVHRIYFDVQDMRNRLEI